MKYLTTVLSAFCASSIFIGALYMLCPEGNMKKSVKYILSLVFLVSVIAVGSITVEKADIKLPKAEEINSEELELSSAEYVYSFALKQAGVDFKEIYLYTDNSKDGGIRINKVRISSAEAREKIMAALEGINEKIEVEITNE